MSGFDPAARLKRLYKRTIDVLELYRQGEQSQLSPMARVFATIMQLVALAARESQRDRVVQEAATLAFFTILSLVPLLAVVTALLGAYGVFDPVDGGLAVYLEVLFPAAGMEIVSYLQEFSTRGASSIGGINGVVLLVISIFLFNSIERSLTNIWRGSHDRSIISKFLMFYAMITLGPLLIILSVVQTASAQLYVTSRFGIDTGAINHFLPILYTLLVFALMNKILPHVYVTWRSALIGGVVTAVGFELAKWGFNQYVNLVLLDSYNRLYGALGIIPIVLLWIYITWIVILIGSEVSYCHQHMAQLIKFDTPLEESLSERGKQSDRRVYNVMVGLDVLSPVVNAFARGHGGVSEAQLVVASGQDVEVVREVVDRLIRKKVLLVVGKGNRSRRTVVPARPLEAITLSSVLKSFYEQDVSEDPVIGELRVAHTAAMDELMEGKTAQDLVGAQGMQHVNEVLGVVDTSSEQGLDEVDEL